MDDNTEKTEPATDRGVEMKPYIPSGEQLHQVAVLLELVNECKQSGINTCIVGGYGLDALYGSLTRDHGDIDMLVEDAKLQDTRDIVERMGFVEDTGDTDENKNLYRPGRGLELPDSFKIEFGTIGSYSKFFPRATPLESIIPKEENGSIMGTPIRTLTLEGHRLTAEVQNQRAVSGGWGVYKHEEHFVKMMSVLSNKK